MKLNYKEFGQGEPIIILHGLFGTLDNWQTIAKKLAEEYWVFIIDQRNHGRSPHEDECKLFAKYVLPKLTNISLAQAQGRIPEEMPSTPLGSQKRN